MVTRDWNGAMEFVTKEIIVNSYPLSTMEMIN